MKITFTAHPWVYEDKLIRPKPSKLEIPKWFKELPTSTPDSNKTLKTCMPFIDATTSGYIIPSPQDYAFNWKVEDGKSRCEIYFNGVEIDGEQINVNTKDTFSFHPKEQICPHFKNGLKSNPLIQKNNELDFFKIFNPWTIKTPPGYSCLFLPIINDQSNDFEVISGLVDTDVYPAVNFPIIIKSKKDFVIKKGQKIVQCIPFKRDDFTMELKSNKDVFKKVNFSYNTVLKFFYKNNFWKKKKWN